MCNVTLFISARAAREHYRLTHPDDINEIEAMAREVAKTKHCSSTAIPK